MIQMSFSEKLKVLVDVSSSSGICIASIFLLIFMAALFLTTNRKNAKSSKKLYASIYILLLIVVFIVYHDSLSTMFDYMMNNFFIVFYFPNLAIYLAAIIATNIILLVTIFNFREDKILKYLNTTIYCMIHYLLVLILNVVAKNKLDVFDQTSIYKNTDASAIISLTSTIFIVWIIFIIIYKLIRKRQKKNQKVRIPVRRVIKYKKKLPENYEAIDAPSELVGSVGNIKEKGVYVEGNLFDFYKNEAKEKEQELIKEYDSMLTLADYKKVLEILKSNSSIKLDKEEFEEEEDLTEEIESSISQDELTSSQKEETEKENVPQPKLEELLNLYKSI